MSPKMLYYVIIQTNLVMFRSDHVILIIYFLKIKGLLYAASL
jgi:hypothetical protein